MWRVVHPYLEGKLLWVRTFDTLEEPRRALLAFRETYNGTWLIEKRLGMVVPDFREIAGAVEQLLTDATFAELQRNVSAYKNYAIFEVPLILDQMMAEKAIESMGVVSPLATIDPFASVAWAGLT